MFNLFSKVTKEDKIIMDSVDDVTLADWSNELNIWSWPKELPNPETTEYIKNGRRCQLMNEIKKRVGEKLVNRRWNKDSMTDIEHEEFWNSDRNLLNT